MFYSRELPLLTPCSLELNERAPPGFQGSIPHKICRTYQTCPHQFITEVRLEFKKQFDLVLIVKGPVLDVLHNYLEVTLFLGDLSIKLPIFKVCLRQIFISKASIPV